VLRRGLRNFVVLLGKCPRKLSLIDKNALYGGFLIHKNEIKLNNELQIVKKSQKVYLCAVSCFYLV